MAIAAFQEFRIQLVPWNIRLCVCVRVWESESVRVCEREIESVRVCERESVCWRECLCIRESSLYTYVFV